jgi:two-component system, OmpR family, response regulator
VAKGQVLLIEADAKVAMRLRDSLGAKGFHVEVCTEARAGFERACSLEPDCIVCNIALPDIDGFWVARRVRTEPGPVASTPFLFLADSDNEDDRLQGLQVGADVYLSMPFTHEEVQAQVTALIDMARRLRARRDSFVGEGATSSKQGVAFRGDLAQMPLASILMMLEMERRSGQLKVSNDAGASALFTLIGGTFVQSEMNGKEGPALDVLRDVLRWRAGKFYFTPRDLTSKAAPRVSIGEMLLTAMQLEDESRQ